ncbi:hypothetical protein FNV43_RR13898 [Rhamnella rubrinervis]|uniref:Uncharacterized protein n=1 Tax=Rhamnella rubrinervis TaxID=2594499 RepID=A0A8K0H291_9ROSA|nr:hypothetical protein FNV43_RR13898 [Rhamnella rubrinervis]
MVSNDDFSFPTITTNPVSHFTIPPTSLWRISSVVYPDCSYNQEGEDHNQKGISIKQEGSSSSSSTELSKKIVFSDEVDSDQQERMDMLWEDFNINEELKMVSCSLDFGNMKKTRYHDHHDERRRASSGYFHGVGDHQELCCVQALKISNKTTISKRPNMVLMRALKKLFFIHNLAHRTRKT